MRILYLSYWNVEDPLTSSTVFPHLEVLQSLDFVSKIVFVNTERGNGVFEPGFALPKIVHYPLYSRNYRPNLLNKIADFVRFPEQISRLVLRCEIDMIIARGAPAGALAYLSYRRTGKPFIVESFEPHASYMLESGVWNRFDPRYIFQQHWESKQKRYARGLMPVADHYRNMLIQEGVDPKSVVTVPCMADERRFSFDAVTRSRMRQQLQVTETTVVGIYAGRFGGLYLEDECFDLYEGAFRYFPDFFLVILTPPDRHEWVVQHLSRRNIPADKYLVRFVPHNTVNDYLCMSDFAFATYKPGRWKRNLSPVKVGEYWRCGLPVVLTCGIGDEASMIEQASAGVLFDPGDMNSDNLSALYQRIERQLGETGTRDRIKSFVHRLRDPSKVVDAYKLLLRN